MEKINKFFTLWIFRLLVCFGFWGCNGSGSISNCSVDKSIENFFSIYKKKYGDPDIVFSVDSNFRYALAMNLVGDTAIGRMYIIEKLGEIKTYSLKIPTSTVIDRGFIFKRNIAGSCTHFRVKKAQGSFISRALNGKEKAQWLHFKYIVDSTYNSIPDRWSHPSEPEQWRDVQFWRDTVK